MTRVVVRIASLRVPGRDSEPATAPALAAAVREALRHRLAGGERTPNGHAGLATAVADSIHAALRGKVHPWRAR
jgi:hypothetical protein